MPTFQAIVHKEMKELLANNGFRYDSKNNLYYYSEGNNLFFCLSFQVHSYRHILHFAPIVSVCYVDMCTLYEALCGHRRKRYHPQVYTNLGYTIPDREFENKRWIRHQSPGTIIRADYSRGWMEWSISEVEDRNIKYAEIIECINQYAKPFYEHYGQFDNMLKVLKNKMMHDTHYIYTPIAYFFTGKYSKGLRELKRGSNYHDYSSDGNYFDNYCELIRLARRNSPEEALKNALSRLKIPLSSATLDKLKSTVKEDLCNYFLQNGFQSTKRGYVRDMGTGIQHIVHFTVYPTDSDVQISLSIGVVYQEIETIYEQLCDMKHPSHLEAIRADLCDVIPGRHIWSKSWSIDDMRKRKDIYEDLFRCFDKYANDFYAYYGQFDNLLGYLRNSPQKYIKAVILPIALFLKGDSRKGLNEVKKGIRNGVFLNDMFSKYPDNYRRLIADTKA